MKSTLLVLILLVSFLSANAAELSCVCSEDTTTHSQEGKTTIEKSVHHNDQDSAESDHQDHCQHTCMQCHLAAVVPTSFILKFDSNRIYTSYLILDQLPHEFGQSLYRPPIS